MLSQGGCTVLYRAANYGQEEMVAELLRHPKIKVNLATVVSPPPGEVPGGVTPAASVRSVRPAVVSDRRSCTSWNVTERQYVSPPDWFGG